MKHKEAGVIVVSAKKHSFSFVLESYILITLGIKYLQVVQDVCMTNTGENFCTMRRWSGQGPEAIIATSCYINHIM